MLLPLFFFSHPALLYFLHQVFSCHPLVPGTLLPPAIFFCPLSRHLRPDFLWPMSPHLSPPDHSFPSVPFQLTAWSHFLSLVSSVPLLHVPLILPPSRFLPLCCFSIHFHIYYPLFSLPEISCVPPLCPSGIPPCQPQPLNPLVSPTALISPVSPSFAPSTPPPHVPARPSPSSLRPHSQPSPPYGSSGLLS